MLKICGIPQNRCRMNTNEQPECDAMRNLADGGLIPHDFTLRCRDCRYTRHMGNAPVTIGIKATGHAMRKAHTVDVSDHGVITSTVDYTRDKLTSGVDSDPPF